ncbi:hypothetical protein [Massilia phyllosphaerae]|uniref:hypothetical protein n=1 Tax=Massilia phyllosphaerae TaxID=3106034 RepID=UPI002B1CBAC2|nr:hypothetical protein [Massilia sp. SGZ-792]
MGWSIGYDSTWERDIGYGVLAHCDHPGCTAEIDRGLGHVCGDDVYGGEHGCGLFICSEHTHSNRHHHQLCQHCADRRRRKLQPSPDHPEWMRWKLEDESWQQWRDENPADVEKLRSALNSIAQPKKQA